MKYRILEIDKCNRTHYTIEKRHRFLFWTYWQEITESVWDGYMDIIDCTLIFNTIEEAKQYICEQSKHDKQIIYEI